MNSYLIRTYVKLYPNGTYIRMRKPADGRTESLTRAPYVQPTRRRPGELVVSES